MTKHHLLHACLMTPLLSFFATAALAQGSAATPPATAQLPGQTASQPGAGQANSPAPGQPANQASSSPAIGTQSVSNGNSSKAANSISAPSGLKPIPGLYDKECKCQAQLAPGQQSKSRKNFKILKGLGKELGIEMDDLGKDMFLAFSVQGSDPYEMPENPNIPYVAAEAQYVDGSASDIYKYPDQSWRVSGGFLDGTYACEQSDGLFIVQYPNGARGTMKMTAADCEIIRPDNTVTSISRTGGGAYRVTNSKLGYMGDIRHTTGLSYEFARQNF